MAVVKSFQDGSFLEFDRGNFDDWCVYLTPPVGKRYPLRDADYFQTIKNLASKYGTERIYADYVSIYNVTGREVDEQVLQQISQVARQYGEDSISVDVLLSSLYMTMIAEECKENTRLGRRIKRLGIHHLLFEGASVHQAANFMRGMGWREIARLCNDRGF